MAIITNLEQLNPIIPKGFGNGANNSFNHVSDSIIMTRCVFGMIYDLKERRFMKIFKVLFGTYKTANEGHLIIGDWNQPVNSKTPSVKKSVTELFNSKDCNIWGFENDEVGLFIRTTWPKEYKIYFGTEFVDIGKMREIKKRNQSAKIVTAETVYV